MAPTSQPIPAADARPIRGTLTVRVLARSSETPIAGATVQTLRGEGTTDASGVCVLLVSAGETVDVSVSADGYQTMGASGVLGSNERWTFYLPAASAPAN